MQCQGVIVIASVTLVNEQCCKQPTSSTVLCTHVVYIGCMLVMSERVLLLVVHVTHRVRQE